MARVTNFDNLRVVFVDAGDTPSVYVADAVIGAQTIVYIIGNGTVRAVNNLPPLGLTFSQPNSKVVTVVDALVQFILVNRPIICAIGVTWAMQSNSVQVSASSAVFENFMVSGPGLAIYGNDTIFQCKSIVDTLATGKERQDDLIINGAELGQTLKLTLPSGSKVSFQDWLMTGAEYTGFSLLWEGAPSTFYVYQKNGKVVEASGDRWIGSAINAITFYNPTPKTIDTNSADDQFFGVALSAW